MEERLQFIIGNVNNWLKFAEAKNGAIIALNGASIFGVLQSLQTDKDLKVCIIFILLILIISTCLALYTYIPVLTGLNAYTKLTDTEFQNQKQSLNSLFYGSLAKITPDQLLVLLSIKDNSIETDYTDIHKDYASQIIINSEITLTKYTLFKWASIFTVAAFVIGIIGIIMKIC